MYLTFTNAHPTVFLYRPIEDENAQYMQTFYKAAEEYKGKIFFTYFDGTSDLDREVRQFLNISDNHIAGYKSLRAAVDNVIYYEPHDPELLTVDQILAFVDDVLNQEAPNTLRSEEIPDYDSIDFGPVLKIVGKNHKKITKDPKKHVMVLYCSPGVSWCEEFYPVWE